MAHQITITLSDEEYADLLEAAKQHGQNIEEAAQRRLGLEHARARHIDPIDPLLEIMYLAGDIENIPTEDPVPADEPADLEALIQQIAPGKPLSEMVIEDRGPY